MKEIALLRLLLSVEGVGVKTVISLREKFGSAEEIFRADFSELRHVGKIGEISAKRILTAASVKEKALSTFEREYEKLQKIGAEIVSYWDEEYPEALHNVYLPPVILYVLGQTNLLASRGIAVVGTRKPTRYGLKQTERFTESLVRNGLTVVSGLARGIDTRAHRTALDCGGKTVAVLGSGLDYVYPPENKNLFREIAENGLVVTEYPLGTKPDAVNFPRRNRIISGLSLGVLVVETKLSGGALHTAAYALEQGREVFAVPGNLDSPQSEGTNGLIMKGEAKLVTDAEDILDELRITSPEQSKKREREIDTTSLDVFEAKIYSVLSAEPLHIDKIANVCNMNSAECAVYLLNLELKGLAEQLPGKYFVKA